MSLETVLSNVHRDYGAGHSQFVPVSDPTQCLVFNTLFKMISERKEGKN